jgi:protein-disulfide isomerase
MIIKSIQTIPRSFIKLYCGHIIEKNAIIYYNYICPACGKQLNPIDKEKIK